MPKINKFIKDNASDKVKPKILISSALTAVTLAFVSSRLTTVVNSVILVAVVSILAALFNEFYRIFFEGIHQIFLQTEDGERDEDTTESDKSTAEKDTAPSADALRGVARRLLGSRWAPNLIFAFMAILTLFGTSLVNQQRPDEYKIEQNIIKKEAISKEKESELISEAEAKAKTEGERAEYSANQNTEVEVTQLKKEISLLETELKARDEDNAKLTERVNKLEEQLLLLSGEIEALRQLVEENNQRP